MKNILRDEAGFTLIEMMIVVGIIAVLAAIAIPRYNNSITMANTAKVQADLSTIDTALGVYYAQQGNLPTTLSQLDSYVDVSDLKAPKGNVYIDGEVKKIDEGSTYELDTNKGKATFLKQTGSHFSNKGEAGKK